MDVYLDYAATTPMSEESLAVYIRVARQVQGNPASSHTPGASAKHELELARSRLAGLYGLRADEVIFTSGATESMNWVIKSLGTREGVVFASPLEHPCALEPLKALGERVQWLPVTPSGVVDFPAAATLLKTHAAQICALVVMGANNETGVIQPVSELASLVKRLDPAALVLSDLVALAPWGVGPETLRWVDIGVLSPHKVGGPVGIGVVLRRRDAVLPALLVGGGQEYDARAGTVSVPLVASGVEALVLAGANSDEYRSSVGSLQRRFEDGLDALGRNLEVVGREVPRVGITSVVVHDCRAEDVLFLLDSEGIYASAGAACASGAMSPSHVLIAQGYSPDDARSQVRLSFSATVTSDDIDHTVAVVQRALAKLQRR